MKLSYSNLPVFLTHDQLSNLRSSIINELQIKVHDISKLSAIRKNNREKLIQELNKMEPKNLWKTYINIELRKKNAINNTYNIIKDFIKDNNYNFKLTGNKKDFIELLIDDYTMNFDDNEDKYFPIGRVFSISLSSKKTSTSWLKKILSYFNSEPTYNQISHKINVNDVVSIKGVFGHSVLIKFLTKTMILEWKKGNHFIGGTDFEGSITFVDNKLMTDHKTPYLSVKDYFSARYFNL